MRSGEEVPDEERQRELADELRAQVIAIFTILFIYVIIRLKFYKMSAAFVILC